MALGPLTPRSVFRYFNVDGVPSSGNHKPSKAEIIQLLETLFGTSRGGWVVARTREELNGIVPGSETDGGVVLADPDPANNGYYERSAGAWVKGRGFPDTFARVDLSGDGTMQSGDVKAGVNPADIEVFYAFVETMNTGPLRLSIGGGEALPVVNLAGNPVAPGEWSDTVMFALRDGKYQLLLDAGSAASAAQSASDAAASAVVAGEEAQRAEDEADRAKDEADRAQGNADDAASYAGYRDFADVQDLLTNTSLQYGTDPGQVQPGDFIRTRKEGFSYEVAAPDATDAHVETAGGVKLEVILTQAGAHNVLAWGANPDYHTTKTDNYAIIQKAIDTRKPIYIPAGAYYSSGTFNQHKGQIIFGDGNNERSVINSQGVTRIYFAPNVDGFDNVPNIAIGSSIKNLAIIAESTTYESESCGVKLGIRNVVSGSSQSVGCHLEGLHIAGFDINVGIHGESWEVTLVRVRMERGRTANLEATGNFTLLTMTDCTWLGAGLPYPGDTVDRFTYGMYLYGPDNNRGGMQVVLTGSSRFENNTVGGISIHGNVRVKADAPYFEGNRKNDVMFRPDFSGSFVAEGGVCMHDRPGEETDACFRVLSTKKCFIKVTGFRFVVGGISNNTLVGGFFIIENPIPFVVVEGLLVGPKVSEMSSGNKRIVYWELVNRYAPQEFSVADLPNVKFYRRGYAHIAKIEGSRPTSLMISDGMTSYDMLRVHSIATQDGAMYRWDGASWVAM